ncbi:hypothetical protein BU23DRAFT_559484 [Bimuria novae-zelandiae CBS 107.79]|uniref:Protein kinase domain-containing protein n=1 Tax=Bimuria novae-zelandiae CBS 107.79 TaxID=1447943 RepID=A0A6A5URF4_9PLEO|nr:hypothetical protein BU23DRAFT_559484 [Bimuria novae-zelandiae CBS 107.79]
MPFWISFSRAGSRSQSRSRSRSRSPAYNLTDLRQEFNAKRNLTAAHAGAMNHGILLVRSRIDHKLNIEKRVSRADIRSGHAHREARAMLQCSHPHIIQTHGASLDATAYGYGSIFMEHCALGSLDELISRFHPALPTNRTGSEQGACSFVRPTYKCSFVRDDSNRSIFEQSNERSAERSYKTFLIRKQVGVVVKKLAIVH